VLTWVAHKSFVNRTFPLAAVVSRPISKKLIRLAAAELLADKLPFTPNRISPGPLAVRVASGAACGAAVTLVARESAKEGALLGGAGALAGAFGGYYARKTFRKSYPDLAVALAEDGVALALALGISRQVTHRI
jgi:uncharacterized membrane protein